jgi:hypothetical protein
MSSVVISGDTSGTVTLQAPAVAGSVVVTMPSTSMTLGAGSLLNIQYFTVASRSATLTIASPCVVTYSGSGANLPSAGSQIVFSTTGALPTGITAGTTYYVINASGTTSNIAATRGGTAINTSGTQSGTQSVSSGTYTATAGTNLVLVQVVGGGGEGSSSGSNGGTSSFGAFCSATGGIGGTTNPSSGGVGTGGDLNISGTSGFLSGSNSFAAGGFTFFGIVGAGGGASGNGTTGTRSAGGGGFSQELILSGFSGTTVTVGECPSGGRAGIVIVYEYS